MKGALPGTACSVGPRERSGFPGRERFPTFSDDFPLRDFFRVPCSRFSLWKAIFPGMEHYHPPWKYFRSILFPRVFWLSGRAPTSVRTGPWFEPRLSSCFFAFAFFCMGFSITSFRPYFQVDINFLGYSCSTWFCPLRGFVFVPVLFF